jgi:N-acetylglutamate synthase/N-acetylornithine aminotransferase
MAQIGQRRAEGVRAVALVIDIFTDAAVSPEFLQRALSAANGRSFSCITVDGDTRISISLVAPSPSRTTSSAS